MGGKKDSCRRFRAAVLERVRPTAASLAMRPILPCAPASLGRKPKKPLELLLNVKFYCMKT
jgi:hypothetical protein